MKNYSSAYKMISAQACFIGMLLLFFLTGEKAHTKNSSVCPNFSSEDARLKLSNETYDKTISEFTSGEIPSKITSQVLDMNNDGKLDKVYILNKSSTASMGSELFVAFHGFSKTTELEQELKSNVYLLTENPKKEKWKKEGVMSINLGSPSYLNHTYNEIVQLNGVTYVYTNPAQPLYPVEVFKLDAERNIEKVCSFPLKRSQKKAKK